MNDYINDLLSRQKVMGASDRLQDIVEFIKKGPATKKQIMEFLLVGVEVSSGVLIVEH